MVALVFSRHAQRRMKLYRIRPEDVQSIIHGSMVVHGGPGQRYEVVSHESSRQYGHPLKVVYVWEGVSIIVVTVYPLKQGA